MSGLAIIIGLVLVVWVWYVIEGLRTKDAKSDTGDSVTVTRIDVRELKPILFGSRVPPDAVLWLVVYLNPHGSWLWTKNVKKAVELCRAEAPLSVHAVMPYGQTARKDDEADMIGYFPRYGCSSLHAFYKTEPKSFDAAFAELGRIVEITNKLAAKDSQRKMAAEQSREEAAEHRKSELRRIESAARRALREKS